MSDSEITPPGDPVALTPRIPALSIVCPGCGAKLSNTQSDPGTKIRCLNCGTRFTPGVPLDKNEDTSSPTKSGAPAEKKVREPRAAGYWLLRVPTILYAAGACAVFVFLLVLGVWIVADDLLRGTFSFSSWMQLIPILYAPLLPLSAYLFYALATSLSLIEAGTLKALYKLNLLDDSLPPVPGSSLPYIAPLSVGASCMVAAIVSTSADDYRNSYRQVEEILITGLFAAGAFFVAFTFEDVRQFFWRQRVMAEAAARAIPGNKPSVPSTPLSGLGLFPTLTVLGFGTAFAFQIMIQVWRSNESMAEYAAKQTFQKGQPIPTDAWYFNNQGGAEILIGGVLVCTVFAAAWTIYLLGAKCAAAVQSWRVAARSPDSWSFSSSEISVDLMFLRLSLVAFAFVGSCWFFYQIVTHKSYRQSYQTAETVNMLIVMFSCGLACLAVSSILTHVREWRLAQERYWRARSLKVQPRLNWLQFSFITFGFILATVELFGFPIIIISEIGSRGGRRFIDEEFIPICLAAYAMHFPIFFTIIITRDLLLIQNGAANAAAAASSAADAALTSQPTAAPHYPANTHTAAPEIPASP